MEIGIALPSCPVMLHSYQDLSHDPDRSLSDFLYTKLMSGCKNIPRFSPWTVFLQTQSHMSKRQTAPLPNHTTQQRCAPNYSIRPAEAFHSLWPSVRGILHES